MTATEQTVCATCGGDQAYTFTDIGYSYKVVICHCVPTDAPPPDMYFRIMAAIRAEEAKLYPTPKAEPGVDIVKGFGLGILAWIVCVLLVCLGIALVTS